MSACSLADVESTKATQPDRIEVADSGSQLRIAEVDADGTEVADLTLTDTDFGRQLLVHAGGKEASRRIEGVDMGMDLSLPTLGHTQFTEINTFLLKLQVDPAAATALGLRRLRFHERGLISVAAPAPETPFWACAFGNNFASVTACCEQPGRSNWPANSREQLICGITPTGDFVYADRICIAPFTSTLCGQTGPMGCKPCWDPLMVYACAWSGDGAVCGGGIDDYATAPAPYQYVD